MGPDRLSQVVAALLRLMIVMMLLVLVVVEAGRVPGVDWGKIKVWEGPALDECWDLLSEFDQFRTHLLRGLSDLGLLDHLLDDWNGTLKVLDGVGGKTGVIITKLSASASAGGTSGQTGTSTAPEDAGGLTLKAMRVKSLEFIRRLLRGGPILDMLELMVDEKGDPSNFNPLVFLYALDLRFRPENDQDKEDRLAEYNAWEWDLTASSNVNISRAERLVRNMRKAGVAAEYIPDNKQLLSRIRSKLLRKLPSMVGAFDLITSAGGPAHGNGKINAIYYIIYYRSL